jgi:3-hydroxybutyryl-CoA dehydratase
MSELTAGAELEPFVVESVSAEAMRTIAALLRDPTPIHFAPEVVARLGMGDRVINQGPANLGYVMNALLAAAPAGRIERVEVRFKANVRAGDRAVAGGVVTELDDAGERVACDVWLDVQDGDRALEGTAVVLPGDG